jgi:hypothetical protein
MNEERTEYYGILGRIDRLLGEPRLRKIEQRVLRLRREDDGPMAGWPSIVIASSTARMSGEVFEGLLFANMRFPT